jgi:hypothetical protein
MILAIFELQSASNIPQKPVREKTVLFTSAFFIPGLQFFSFDGMLPIRRIIFNNQLP